jgi:hypothetical protein
LIPSRIRCSAALASLARGEELLRDTSSASIPVVRSRQSQAPSYAGPTSPDSIRKAADLRHMHNSTLDP